MKTVADFLRCNRNSENEIKFILGKEKQRILSYEELYVHALKVLGFLQKKGITEGDEIIFQISDNMKFLCLFWACILGKIIPVPLLVGNNDEHKRKVIKIWNRLKDPYLVIEEENLEKTGNDFERIDPESDPAKRWKERSFTVEDALRFEQKGTQAQLSEDDICFIQFSSGSTGEPKGVVLTHRNLVVNTYDILTSAGIRKDDRVLNWMPLTHDMGLIGSHLSALRFGLTQIIMPTVLFSRRPLLWLELIEKERVTVSSSPNFGYRFVLKFWERKKKKDAQAALDLSSLRLLFNGAEPIDYSLEKQFLEVFGEYGLRRNCILNVYGLAEASLAVCFPKPHEEIKVHCLKRESLKIGHEPEVCEEGSLSAVHLVEVGQPVGDLQIKPVDEEGRRVEEGRTGYLYIKGENVTGGYYHDEEATRAAFDHEGFLNTGDIGFFAGENLVITGRAKDIVFINGQNYYPPDIEKICENLESIELNTVASCGARPGKSENDRLCIFVIFHGRIEEFANTAWEIKMLIQRSLGIEPDYILPVQSLPKTTSGKLQRFSLARGLENGDYDHLIAEVERALEEKKKSMIEQVRKKRYKNPTEARLFELCAQYTDMSRAETTDNFFDLGLTSMTIVRLAEDMKREFGKQVLVTDVFSYPTIEKAAAFIEAWEEEGIFIRRNLFKQDFVHEGNRTDIPMEAEADCASDADERILEFLKRAVLGERIVIYQEEKGRLHCVEIKEGSKREVENFPVSGLEHLKQQRSAEGFSIVVTSGQNSCRLEKYFDLVIEKINARYGDMIVFTVWNQRINLLSLMEEK